LQLADGRSIETDQAVSCVYSDVNDLLHNSGFDLLPLKHELAELALVRPPAALAAYGITVMDGPFFSVMPFPAEQLHSFSHVRYTPHEAWQDSAGYRGAQQYFDNAQPRTHFPQMLKDAVRYMPVLAQTQYERSLFEMKAILTASERNDGRPILFRRDYGLPGFHVVLGGKIDNIYDIGQAIGLSTRFLPPLADGL
jgi:glycine/D-amino acid oxidase-like deaminating enzyme